ncbi:MAG TPA: TolC family protein [Gemmatimonadales bacterium]|nr:TolC family protein [Gemmatimonadales bacterium]
MLALLAMLQLQVAETPPPLRPTDSLPVVTLAEALRRATGLDPNYVAAAGQVDNAEWARRSAFAVFILPSITLGTDVVWQNPKTIFFAACTSFTSCPQAPRQVTSQVTASYDLFLGGRKFSELSRSGAALESAQANELATRFTAAQRTESTYYAVLADAELLRVAGERLQRAEQQLAVARARVVSGAAVQTDSLQLRLELTKARVGHLVQEAALRIARLELGRRVGTSGPADAAPLDTAPAPELPLALTDAITEAATQGPQYRLARANERAAGAAFRARLGEYLPKATLSFNALAGDTLFFPKFVTRTSVTLSVSFPLWDNGQREIRLSQARVDRDVAQARSRDMDRAVRRDVTAAYDGYVTARATAQQAAEGLRVAQENFRVQQSRYRAGATAILDLLTAQANLDDAAATLVQARFATRLALAGLESILGRRLFPELELK